MCKQCGEMLALKMDSQNAVQFSSETRLVGDLVDDER